VTKQSTDQGFLIVLNLFSARFIGEIKKLLTIWQDFGQDTLVNAQTFQAVRRDGFF
jgi:hypothetical protein